LSMIKIIATRCYILRLKCTKFYFRRGWLKFRQNVSLQTWLQNC